MTIQELIDQLSKIEDKDREIIIGKFEKNHRTERFAFLEEISIGAFDEHCNLYGSFTKEEHIEDQVEEYENQDADFWEDNIKAVCLWPSW